jgi:hypothetical protein
VTDQDREQLQAAAHKLAPLIEPRRGAGIHGLCLDDRCVDVDAGLDPTPLETLFPGAF